MRITSPPPLQVNIVCCHTRFDHRQKVIVPLAVVPVLFDYFHTFPLGRHLGTFKTINKIHENFIWKSMDTDIHYHVHHFRVCTLSKLAQNWHLRLTASEVSDCPFQKIINYFSKSPCSNVGNTMMLVYADSFLKFVWLTLVREGMNFATVKALRDTALHFSPKGNCIRQHKMFHFTGV